ncbi:MAG: DegT/DnrJ/EryC1/StrS family aminotransferase [Nanoarchaeota archaeon]
MIKLMKSTFYKEEETKKKLCDFIMQTEKLSMGEKCLEFEKKFSTYQGRKYSVFFNSGSSANFALIYALINLGLIKKGDNVGFSVLTWATNVMPLLQLNLNPIPIDVSLSHLNISSGHLEKSLEKFEKKCLFLTNLLGFCGDLDEIRKICDDKKILLIEDNCESLGSEFKGKKLGNFGLASTSSFYVGHHLSTIEGGMVCTDDEELFDMLRKVRAHGWDRNLEEEKQEKLKEMHNIDDFYSRYTFYTQGFNFRPTEIQGFIGVEQLRYIDDLNKIRNKNFLEFDSVVKDNSDFHRLDVGHMDFISNFAYPLICKDKESFEEYKNKFKDKVEIRPIVGGSMVEQPFFRNYLSHKTPKEEFNCINAGKIHKQGFYFPNNAELTKEEKLQITELLR